MASAGRRGRLSQYRRGGEGGFEAAPLPARNFSMHRGWPFPWLHAPFLWARESYLLGDSDRSYNDPSLCTYAFLRRACNPGLHHYCLFNLDCWCFFFFFPRILSPVSARLHFWCSITSGFTILWWLCIEDAMSHMKMGTSMVRSLCSSPLFILIWYGKGILYVRPSSEYEGRPNSHFSSIKSIEKQSPSIVFVSVRSFWDEMFFY